MYKCGSGRSAHSCYYVSVLRLGHERFSVNALDQKSHALVVGRIQPKHAVETRLRSILKVTVMTISARFEKGVFRPLQDVPIKEGTVVEVLLPTEVPAKRPPSIADSSFAGMWKDRDDMADSVEYINRLRRELHG